MPNKIITISFYDVCLLDYFGGHYLPVLSYPVDGTTTRAELWRGLCSELHGGVIDYEIEKNSLDCDDIRQAIKDCLYFNPECQDNDILFPDLEIWGEEEDGIDSCHAFFVLRWEEEEGANN